MSFLVMTVLTNFSYILKFLIASISNKTDNYLVKKRKVKAREIREPKNDHINVVPVLRPFVSPSVNNDNFPSQKSKKNCLMTYFIFRF